MQQEVINEYPEVTLKLSYRPSNWYPIGIAVAISLLSWATILSAFPKYPRYDLCLMSGFVMAIFVYFLFRFFLQYNFNFYGTHILAYQRLRNKRLIIPYENIESHTVVEKKYKNTTHYVLHFKAIDNQYFKLCSEYCEHITEFNEMHRHVEINSTIDADCSNTIERSEYREWGYGLMLVGSLMYLISSEVNSDFKWQEQPTEQTSVAIYGTVDIFESRNSKSHYWYDLKLREYPDFIFDIDHSAYRALSGKLIKSDPIKPNDKLYLHITKKDFDFKISQNKQPTWKDFCDIYNNIEPCSIEKETIGTVYYSVSDYVKEGGIHQSDGSGFRFYMIILFLIGMFMWIYNLDRKY